jgi:alpha-beta hydrolase superfamily lysophospholipase
MHLVTTGKGLICGTLTHISDKFMHRAQTNLEAQQVEQLRDNLQPFDPKTAIDIHANIGLRAYLDFYSLPKPSDNRALFGGYLHSNDQQTLLMVWQPAVSVGTAIVVHGYLDHTGLYGHLIETLLDRGLTVVCYDLIGHGLSSGQPASIQDFSQYVSQLNQVLSATAELCTAPLHGLGQSTGGAILLKQLIEYDNRETYPFSSLDLLAPLVQPKHWALNRWLFALTRPFRKTAKRVFRANSQDAAFLHFIRHTDPFQPHRLPSDWISAMAEWVAQIHDCTSSPFAINVIQGDNDSTLDWQHNIELLQRKFPHMRLHLIPGAGHQLVNEEATLRQEIFAKLSL